jgi:hypothetical protein
MAFGLLNSIIPSPGPVTNLYQGPANKLTVGKITVGSKNYNPSRIQIGYRDGNDVRYFEYNRYIKYGEVIETENIFIGAGQELLVRSTEPDVNFLYYGQTTNDIINPVRSGVLSHTLSVDPTKQALFTAPVGSESLVTVSICNLGPDPATVKLGLADGDINSFDSTEYLDFGFQIGPGQTYTRPDIKLGAGQSLIGFSNFDSKVTFLCHGKLYYAVSGLPTSDDFIVLGNSRIDGNLGIGRTADHANNKRLDVLGNTRITGQLDVIQNGFNVDGHVNVGLGISVTAKSYFSSDVDITGSLLIKGVSTNIESTTIRMEGPKIELGYLSNSDSAVNNGGIQLKGNTNKEILWKSSNDKWNLTHGLEFPNQSDTISINNIDVLTRDTVLGNTISGTINVSSPTVNSIPTDDAVADYVTTTTAIDNLKTSKEVQIHSFYMSQQWS